MGRVQISGSFLCLLALLIFLDTEGIFLYFLGAAAVHECGHLVAIGLCGGRVRHFALSAAGGVIRYELPCTDRLREGVIALGGCILGGVLAGVAALAGIPLLCGASTLLTLFNLLPISCLDGGRALRLLFGERRIWCIVEIVTLGALLCFGAVVAVCWRGFGLLLITVLLVVQQRRQSLNMFGKNV